ncbi:MAG: hypothetical protein IPH46_16105 [Bacteroidetes bacterium]|nr:hypothetical protein [Bacteroidota bacterium]
MFFDKKETLELDAIKKFSITGNAVITYIESNLSMKEEAAVVKYKSSWDKKEFFSCCDKSHHDKCFLNKDLLIIEK